MFSSLLKSLPELYPYTPSITDTGTIDPQSIHSKTYEFTLAFLTGALACAPFLLKKKPSSWVFLGFGVVSYISYLFWSKLGAWIPNKVADQKCVRRFLLMDHISSGVANRVLKNDDLHNEIFDRIRSLTVSNLRHRDDLLKHNLFEIWDHIPVKNTLSYYLRAVKEMGNQKITKFTPSTECQMHIWTSDSNELVEKNIDLLKMNFNINIKHKGQTPFSTLAQRVIESQNDEKTWFSLLNRMTLLLNAECNPTINISNQRIDKKSSLGLFLQSIESDDKNCKVASLFETCLE